MPTESGRRLCDEFVENIVRPNDADVFAFTDTNDFYYNGVQYFSTNRRVEVLNNDTSRLHSKIDFIDHFVAADLIEDELKKLGFTDVYAAGARTIADIQADPKFESLEKINANGNNPILLLQQLIKMRECYAMLRQAEFETPVTYDVVIRWRFDNTVNGPLRVSDYDFSQADIYVPGVHSPVIYDWFAIGKRNAMHEYMSLYNYAGTFLDDGRMFLCSKCSYNGSSDHNCGGNEMYEISLSVEYHIFKLCQKLGIKLANARYSSCPRRYNNANNRIEDVMKTLNATLVTFKPSVDVVETKYGAEDV